MATAILVRHGRTGANSHGVLAGRTPGVHLDESGIQQAQAVGRRLSALPIAALVTSPLDRCVETAKHIGAAHPAAGRLHRDRRLVECGYGSWTGQDLKALAKDPLWKVVQAHPSAVRFPDGESLREVQARGVEAVRDWNGRVEAEHGADGLWVAVSHGDVIKAVVADALGLHLDQFQRIVVDPGSVTIVRYTALRPFVMGLNDFGSDLSGLKPVKRRRGRTGRTGRGGRDSDAEVGGGAGRAAGAN